MLLDHILNVERELPCSLLERVSRKAVFERIVFLLVVEKGLSNLLQLNISLDVLVVYQVIEVCQVLNSRHVREPLTHQVVLYEVQHVIIHNCLVALVGYGAKAELAGQSHHQRRDVA